jgi:hypothetical protein
VLTFVGVKMVLSDLYKIPVALSLAVIATILGIGIVASVLRNRRVDNVPLAPAAPLIARARAARGVIMQIRAKLALVLVVAALAFFGGAVGGIG